MLDKLLITDDLDVDPAALMPPATDLTGDQKVDFLDYATLIDSWLDEVLWP